MKHQDRGLCRVDTGAIKRKVFGTPHEDNVGFDVVEDARLVAEVLPREEHDGVVGRHGSRPPAISHFEPTDRFVLRLGFAADLSKNACGVQVTALSIEERV